MLAVGGGRSHFFSELSGGGLKACSSENVIERLKALAEVIRTDFEHYPLDIGCAATAYLAGHVEAEFAPILDGVVDSAEE